MTGCVDKSLGQLIHNYELGLLSDDDTSKFEIHLLECDHCRGMAAEFLDVSRVLRHDPDSHAVVDELVAEADTEETGRTKKSTTITRLLLAAAIILVVAYPLYKYVLDTDSLEVSQTIALYPTRSDAGAVIDLDKGGAVVLKFFVDEGFDGDVSLTLFRIGGDTVISQASYTEFDENGTGTLTVPVSSFRQGHYSLVIEPHGDITGAELLQYFFRAD